MLQDAKRSLCDILKELQTNPAMQQTLLRTLCAAEKNKKKFVIKINAIKTRPHGTRWEAEALVAGQLLKVLLNMDADVSILNAIDGQILLQRPKDGEITAAITVGNGTFAVFKNVTITANGVTRACSVAVAKRPDIRNSLSWEFVPPPHSSHVKVLAAQTPFVWIELS